MTGSSDWVALGVTLRLAATVTVCLLVVGLPLAWWIAHTRSRVRPLVEALVALPLVLPPTVLGFYLLIGLGPHGPVGRTLEAWGGMHLAFTFPGLVIASCLHSLPFMVQPLLTGFRDFGRRPLEAAAMLGAGPLDAFTHVALPGIRRSMATALVLTFTHTIGEFGVVLMVGGNIPGATRVLSIALYDHVEAMDYGRAHTLAAGLLIGSFLVLLALYITQARRRGAS
jgi:molybdate transport system permease protein